MPVMTAPTDSLGSSDPAPGSGFGSLVEASLTATCNIYMPATAVADGQGTDTAGAPIIIAAAVACRLTKPHGEREAVQAGALSALSVWTLDVPLGTDLQAPYLVVKDSLTYQVIDTNAGETGAIFLSAMVVRVTGA